MKKFILPLVFILFFTAGFIGYNLYSSLRYLQEEVNISGIDLSNVQDGEYVGEFRAGILSAAVRVEVADHRITGIEILEHQNALGKPAEVIITEVIKKQSLGVDLVNGATLSSKMILKALENGLNINTNITE